MNDLRKIRHGPDSPPESPEKGERKGLKWLIGTTAVGLVVIGGGNAIEQLKSDNFIEIDSPQIAELNAANQQLLEKISGIPFDESGYAEKITEEKPGYKNDLSIALDVEGDVFTIRGQGHHIGHTVQSHTSYNDPVSFKLRYKLDQVNTVQVPTELLKQVMGSNRMPEEVRYSLTENRPGEGRYGDEDGIGDVGSKESGVVMKTGSSGKLISIQVGDTGMFATSIDVTDNAKEAYADVSAELERVGF